MAETYIAKLIETLASGYEMLLQQSQYCRCCEERNKKNQKQNQKETGYIGVKVTAI